MRMGIKIEANEYKNGNENRKKKHENMDENPLLAEWM